MDWLKPLLLDPDSIAHILLVYSVVIAAGVAVGHVKVAGVSLGLTGVLFVGLALNYAGFDVNPQVLDFIREFGLILFVFFIGLQVGPSFFSSFKSGGVLLNKLAATGVALSLAVTVIIYLLFSDTLSLAQVLGIHYGAVTNTPGLGATQEALKQFAYTGENIAVAYACAYPLAVVSIIASTVLLRRFFRIDLAEEDRHWDEDAKANHHAPIYFHVEVTNRALEGRTLGAIRAFIGRAFVGSRLMRGEEISSVTGDTVVRLGDVLRIVTQEEHKEAIVAFFGALREDVDLTTTDASRLMSRRILISRHEVNGMTIADLHLSHYEGANITRVYRAGMELFPYASLHLQVGDTVHCVGPEPQLKRLERTLGNQVKRLETPNLLTIFIGIALGIVCGSLPVALPGMPVPVKLGLAGGPLIVAILLGRYGSHLRLVTYTTSSVNLMLREMGMALFLASVGLAAGNHFVEAVVHGNGPLYMGLGLVITLVPLLIVGYVARRVYRINYHSIMGLLAGTTTNPPALAYAGSVTENNSSAIAYSTVYPLTMFLRIVSGQLILIALWSFGAS